KARLAQRAKWDHDLYAAYIAIAHARRLADDVLEICRDGYRQLPKQSFDFLKACVEATPELDASESLARFASKEDVAWYVETEQKRTQSSQRRFQEAATRDRREWDCRNRCTRYFEGCGDAPNICKEKRQQCEATCN